MPQKVLLTGTPSPLLRDLALLVQQGNGRGIVTTDPDADPPLESDERISVVRWNRRSPISARTVVMQAKNTLDTLEETVIVFSPDKGTGAYHEEGLSHIEERVDAGIRSVLFMTREVLTQLEQQGNGILSFVLFDGGSEPRPPLEGAALGAFSGFVQSLFDQYANEPVLIRGFHWRVDSEDRRGFARFVLRDHAERPERTRGRWVRFGRRGGLFSRTR